MWPSLQKAELHSCIPTSDRQRNSRQFVGHLLLRGLLRPDELLDGVFRKNVARGEDERVVEEVISADRVPRNVPMLLVSTKRN